jgi:hypothetical protein
MSHTIYIQAQRRTLRVWLLAAFLGLVSLAAVAGAWADGHCERKLPPNLNDDLGRLIRDDMGLPMATAPATTECPLPRGWTLVIEDTPPWVTFKPPAA